MRPGRRERAADRHCALACATLREKETGRKKRRLAGKKTGVPRPPKVKSRDGEDQLEIESFVMLRPRGK